MSTPLRSDGIRKTTSRCPKTAYNDAIDQKYNGGLSDKLATPARNQPPPVSTISRHFRQSRGSSGVQALRSPTPASKINNAKKQQITVATMVCIIKKGRITHEKANLRGWIPDCHATVAGVAGSDRGKAPPQAHSIQQKHSAIEQLLGA